MGQGQEKAHGGTGQTAPFLDTTDSDISWRACAHTELVVQVVPGPDDMRKQR